jgi:hypothetical protein
MVATKKKFTKPAFRKLVKEGKLIGKLSQQTSDDYLWDNVRQAQLDVIPHLQVFIEHPNAKWGDHVKDAIGDAIGLNLTDSDVRYTSILTDVLETGQVRLTLYFSYKSYVLFFANKADERVYVETYLTGIPLALYNHRNGIA